MKKSQKKTTASTQNTARASAPFLTRALAAIATSDNGEIFGRLLAQADGYVEQLVAARAFDYDGLDAVRTPLIVASERGICTRENRGSEQ